MKRKMIKEVIQEMSPKQSTKITFKTENKHFKPQKYIIVEEKQQSLKVKQIKNEIVEHFYFEIIQNRIKKKGYCGNKE